MFEFWDIMSCLYTNWDYGGNFFNVTSSSEIAYVNAISVNSVIAKQNYLYVKYVARKIIKMFYINMADEQRIDNERAS